MNTDNITMPAKPQTRAEKQARQLADLKAEIKRLTDLKNTIEANMLNEYAPGTTTQAGEYVISISKPRDILDKTVFKTIYPPQEHPDCYQVEPLPLSQIMRKIGEHNLAECIKPAKPVVKVSRNDE